MSATITGATLRRRLGNNLFRLRTAAGLTQEQAAEKANLDPRYYQKCEHGEANASLATLVKLAAGFDTTPAALLERPARGR